ncbi:MAG: dephospho-CoA kinase [Micrococcales bacterium]|nr:dephospho-CoA kinase [Micrococcales bacterium]
MRRVALTGGLAAGKSTAARLFASHGLPVIDLDALARELTSPPSPALDAITARFGPTLVDDDGTLDRARLAAQVFADDDGRRDLQAILHPLIWARAREQERAWEAQGAPAVMVDFPLLTETGDAGEWDLVITVSAPVETRIARAVSERNMTRDQAKARIAAQVSDEEREAIAAIVLDGSGTVESLEDQVRRAVGAVGWLRWEGAPSS